MGSKETKGYCWDSARSKWLVRQGRKGFYGRYDTEKEAIEASERQRKGIPYPGSSVNTQDNLCRNKGADHYGWKGGKPKCLDCDKQLSSYNNVRCWKCCNIAKSGSNSHRWKGGVSSEDDALRLKFRQQMQHLVFERDNYTCLICDQHSGYLQVDHIKRWSEYPELRFDVDNCRTVCMACHYYITFKRKMPVGIIWGHNLSRRIAS